MDAQILCELDSKQYAKDNGAILKSWHFMTGDQDSIYDLANKGFTLYAGENSEAAGGFAPRNRG